MNGRRGATIAVLAILSLALLTLASAVDAAPVNLHGLVDLTGVAQRQALWLNALDYGDTPFDAYRVRLFGDAPLPGGFQVFTQFVATDNPEGRIRNYAAYVAYAPFASRDLEVMVGKLPWLLGSYGARTYSDKQPLIGTPMMYQYHTSLRSSAVPISADALLAATGTGNYGAAYEDEGEPMGMPIVSDAAWDFGAGVAGSLRPLELMLGVTNGTPGAPQSGSDTNRGKSVMGRLGLAPLPGVRAGVSGSYGAYLPDRLSAQLPASASVNQYAQALAMADVELMFGHLELHGEGFVNRWDSPWVGALGAHGGYVEGKYAFPFGAYVAARGEVMRFDEITSSTGAEIPWDANARRIEAGIGYRFTRAALGKIVIQDNRLDDDYRDTYPSARLIAAQLSVRF